jgi:KaiC/GvpD/RAD55 family RecA-like ATPase
MFQGINAIEFNKRFGDNESCYKYLEALKWPRGYKCQRCGCDGYSKGRTSHHRRCKKCSYDESVTANSIFHGIKMPILKAFHMAFRLTAKKKGMSTTELGCEVGVEQKTAWLFKRKIQAAMKQDSHFKLSGKVDVDETMLGPNKGRGNGGRKLGEREAIMVAAEILGDGRTGNLRMQVIEDFKALTFKYALKDMVSPAADIRTDDYVSYLTVKQGGMDNITQVRSEKGKAFEELHRQIMQFKGWLRGTHHKWSKQHLYAYVDEYVFRFNRRNKRNAIFHSVISKMMHQVPHPYPVIKKLCAHST